MTTFDEIANEIGWLRKDSARLERIVHLLLTGHSLRLKMIDKKRGTLKLVMINRARKKEEFQAYYFRDLLDKTEKKPNAKT